MIVLIKIQNTSIHDAENNSLFIFCREMHLQEKLVQLTSNSMQANRTQVLNLERYVSLINPPTSASKNAVPIKLVRVVADFVKLKFMYPKK